MPSFCDSDDGRGVRAAFQKLLSHSQVSIAVKIFGSNESALRQLLP
jgi:hypothetical protein